MAKETESATIETVAAPQEQQQQRLQFQIDDSQTPRT